MQAKTKAPLGKSGKKKDDGEWSDGEDQEEAFEIPVHAHPPSTDESDDKKDGEINGKEKDSVLFTQTPSAVARRTDQTKKRYPAHLREHVKSGGAPRYQSSSTSTLFVNSTPSAPDINDVLQSMSTALYMHISAGHRSAEPKFIDIFDEEKYPISKNVHDTVQMPRIKIIYKFITTIFRVEKLPPECAILCLAYIERLISLTGLTLHASNWRRVVLAALILASKVWEDQAVWNVDFLSVFPNVTVQDLRLLEKRLLAFLEYNVNVTGGLYAKYYFELRELTEKDNKRFSLQPLDKVGVERLEARANYLEDSVRKKRMRKTEMVRSSSSDNLPLRSPKVILS